MRFFRPKIRFESFQRLAAFDFLGLILDLLARFGRSLMGDSGFFVLSFALCFAFFRKRMSRYFKFGVAFIVMILCVCMTTGVASLVARPLHHFLAFQKSFKKNGAVFCASDFESMVVLGGGIEAKNVPGMSTYFRVLGAVQKTQEKRSRKSGLSVRNLFFSGGITAPDFEVSEAYTMQNLFVQLNSILIETGEPNSLPSPRFYLEEQSMNTFENALYTRAKFLQLKEKQSIYLVTDSLHMPRAVATFVKQGFQVCPVESMVRDMTSRPLFSFEQGSFLATVLHEYLGIAAYWVRGRL